MQNQTIPTHILWLTFRVPFNKRNRKLETAYPSMGIHLIFFRKVFCGQKAGRQNTAFQVCIGELIVTLSKFLHSINRRLALW